MDRSGSSAFTRLAPARIDGPRGLRDPSGGVAPYSAMADEKNSLLGGVVKGVMFGR